MSLTVNLYYTGKNGNARKFPVNKFRWVLEFKEDGSFNCTEYKNGAKVNSSVGKWVYVINKFGVDDSGIS